MSAALAPRPAAGETSPRVRSAVLVSIDSLRADHLSFYGYPRATTPRLAKLVERRGGTVFRRATAVSPSCHPSHTAMLTGLYPQQVGVPWCGEDLIVRWGDLGEPDDVAELERYQESLREQPPALVRKRVSAVRNWLSIPADQETLPGLLQASGFHTLGAVGIWTVTARFGYAAGFDRYFDAVPEYYGPQKLTWLLRDAMGSQRRQPVPATIDAALAALAEIPHGERFFLFLNLADTHVPYDGRGAASWSAASPDRERMEAHWRRRYPEALWPRARQAMEGRDGFLLDRYDAAIRATDAQLGRLVDALAARGDLDETIFVVTSDHGDSFGQHRYLGPLRERRPFFEHSIYVWEETQHVPLLVLAPGDRPGIRFHGANASQVDVAPTLLAALGLAGTGQGRPGRDLAALPEEARTVYFLTFGRGQPGLLQATRLDFPRFIGLRHGDRKFFVDRERFRDPEAGTCYLFDLLADPNELENLCAQQPAEAARLRARLVEWYGRTIAERASTAASRAAASPRRR